MLNSVFIALILGLPKVGFIDLPIIALFIWSLVLNIPNVLRGNIKLTINNNIITILFLLSILVIIVYISSLYNSSISITYTFRPFRMIVIVILLMAILKKIYIDDVFKGILLVSITNSLIVYIQYIFDILGISPLIFHPIGFSETVITPYRKPGIYNGYPVSGLMVLLGIISSSYLYIKNPKIKYTIIIVFLLPTLILTSRTALLEFILFIIFMLLFKTKEIYFKSNIKKVKKFFIFFSLSFMIIILYLYNQHPYFAGSINKAFALFINYYKYGYFLDYSSRDLLENHYQFPDNYLTFLFGNSLQPFQGGVNSDVSFIRILFTTGIFSLLIYIIIFFLGYIYTIKNRYLLKIEKTFIFLVLTSIFIACFKGPYMFSRVLGDITLLFIIYLSKEHYNEKNNISN